MRNWIFALLVCVASVSLDAGLLPEGWYVKGVSGINIVPDQSFSTSGLGLTTGSQDFKLGQMNGAAVGHIWDNGFRAELEFSYRTNHLDKFVSAGTTVVASAEDRTVMALMVNLFYVFDVDFMLKPYVGVGAGTGNVGAHGASSAAGGIVWDDNDWTFAYQAIGGFNYELDEQWELFIEYRYFGTTDPDFSVGGAVAGTLSSEYDSHTVAVGTTFRF